MAKNTPLRIPKDAQALPPVLSSWADAINTRLREIEQAAENLQTQLNNVVKDNGLVP